MKVMAIDPGTTESAWVVWQGDPTQAFGAGLIDWGKQPNETVLAYLHDAVWPALVIEQVASYGMPVGAEVFATVHWSGRFHEAAVMSKFGRVDLMPRKDVKLHLCQSPRANDATIRQAIIDRFGGKSRAIGTRVVPGPLHGVKRDVWQALALALTWHDREASR